MCNIHLAEKHSQISPKYLFGIMHKNSEQKKTKPEGTLRNILNLNTSVVNG